jgi:single-stranded DNA-binding protein
MPSDNFTVQVGNLTDDPELRFTQNGTAVTNFRLAVTQRIKDADGAWRDGETNFFRVNAWRDQAENIAESLAKGNRAIVLGRLRTRTWETPEGGEASLDRDRRRRGRPQPTVGHRQARASRPQPRQCRAVGRAGPVQRRTRILSNSSTLPAPPAQFGGAGLLGSGLRPDAVRLRSDEGGSSPVRTE